MQVEPGRYSLEEEIVSKARQALLHTALWLDGTSSKCEEVEGPHQHGD